MALKNGKAVAGANQYAGATGSPAGMIGAFALTAAPTGWVVCDGSAVSRTTYAVLFAAMGTIHGSGDGTTTFNLPDYRGQFLRGFDPILIRDFDGASRTAMNAGGATGNNVGAVQSDAFQGHYHQWVNYQGGSGGSTGFYNGPTNTVSTGSVRSPTSDGTNGTPRTSSETRPTNATVLYCVKT